MVTYCFVCWRESSSGAMTTCKSHRKDRSKQRVDTKSRNLQTMINLVNYNPSNNQALAGDSVVFLGKTLYSHNASLHPGV